MTEQEFLDQRAQRMAGSAFDDSPIRRHDAQGIGEVRVSQQETYSMALEFLSDIASPEGYGHAVSPEVVKRAVRILATLRPRGYVAPREDQE